MREDSSPYFQFSGTETETRKSSCVTNASTTNIVPTLTLTLPKANMSESPLKKICYSSSSKLSKKHRPNGIQSKPTKSKLLLHSDKLSCLPSVLKLRETNSCKGSSLLAKRNISLPPLSKSKLLSNSNAVLGLGFFPTLTGEEKH